MMYCTMHMKLEVFLNTFLYAFLYAALVDEFKREFIQKRLAHICQDVGFAGGSYELSGIQGSSDYDILFYYKLPGSAKAESETVEGDWVQIKYNGNYLNTQEVMLLVFKYHRYQTMCSARELYKLLHIYTGYKVKYRTNIISWK